MPPYYLSLELDSLNWINCSDRCTPPTPLGFLNTFAMARLVVILGTGSVASINLPIGEIAKFRIEWYFAVTINNPHHLTLYQTTDLPIFSIECFNFTTSRIGTPYQPWFHPVKDFHLWGEYFTSKFTTSHNLVNTPSEKKFPVTKKLMYELDFRKIF
mgnify:CR=1 FL=1